MTGGRSPKVKGSRIERARVQEAVDCALNAERTWGSDGRSAGLAKEVDIIIKVGGVRWTFQSKGMKKMAKIFNLMDNHVDGIIMTPDRQEPVVTIRWATFLQLLVALEKAYERGSVRSGGVGEEHRGEPGQPGHRDAEDVRGPAADR